MSPELAGVIGAAATALVGAIGKAVSDLYGKKARAELARARIEREDAQRHAKIQHEEMALRQRQEAFFAEQYRALMEAVAAERDSWRHEREELHAKVKSTEDAYAWIDGLLMRLWEALAAINHDGIPTEKERRDLQYVIGEARLRLHAHYASHDAE